jgi:deoxyribonuclease-2
MFLSFLRFLSLPAFAIALSCLNADSEPTDVWTILKSPKTADTFLYAASAKDDLTIPSYSLNDTSSGALSATMKQLWLTETSYVLYNDEAPGASTYNYSVGHTKGVLAISSTASEGFWLIHSIPNFPQGPRVSSEGYVGLPSSAWTYGQNAYCLSLDAPTLDLLAYSFRLTWPNIYEYRLTTTVKNTLHNITLLTQGATSSAPICQNHTITTTGGLSHTIFAKSAAWNNDLWSACVGPVLKEDLLVESWIRGSAIGPSCTSSYTVEDVQSVNYRNGESWSEYNDHSKWATSADGSWTCHGDINRMTTQYERGGGGVCVKGLGYSLLQDISSQNSC